MEKNKKILLIEDDEFLRKMYELGLTTAGFSVKTATDGEEGYSLICEEKSADLILLDVIMPKLNGFEVLEKLKKECVFPSAPVVMLTNLGQEEDIKRAMGLGAKEYFIKSNFTIKEVVKKINTILGND